MCVVYDVQYSEFENFNSFVCAWPVLYMYVCGWHAHPLVLH